MDEPPDRPDAAGGVDQRRGVATITVRDAGEADLPRIIAIYNASIPAGRSTADTRPIRVEERLDWFRRFDPQRRPIWVAEREGLVLGCVYLTSFYGGRPAYDRTAEISTYIDPAHQRQGLGTLLKGRMIEACPRLGVDNLISMYFDHNQATQRLNDHFGFEVVGHLPEIADVFGSPRGLKIGLLRLRAQAEEDPTATAAAAAATASAAADDLPSACHSGTHP